MTRGDSGSVLSGVSGRWMTTSVIGDGSSTKADDDLEALLSQGFEPFAATPTNYGGWWFHLRRWVPASDEGERMGHG